MAVFTLTLTFSSPFLPRGAGGKNTKETEACAIQYCHSSPHGLLPVLKNIWTCTESCICLYLYFCKWPHVNSPNKYYIQAFLSLLEVCLQAITQNDGPPKIIHIFIRGTCGCSLYDKNKLCRHDSVKDLELKKLTWIMENFQFGCQKLYTMWYENIDEKNSSRT